MGERQFFVHRADVDDLSRTPRLTKVTHDRLRYKEHALQVDVQNGIEIAFRHVPKVGALLETGVVHKDVDLAESRDGLINESLPFGNLPDVRLKSHRALLGCGSDSRRHFVSASFVLAVADRDVGSITGQALRDRTPYSLIAARYRRHFACQSI